MQNSSCPSSLPTCPFPGGSFGVPPFVVHVRDIVGSTSDDAKALAAEGAPDGSVVWARAQEAGRGRYTRQWLSPPGNLYMSVVLRPAIPASRTAELGFVAALAVAETVQAWLPPGRLAGLKWPNDVLVDGRKIAGILLEGHITGMRLEWVIAGIGINLASAPDNPANPATSLAACGGGKPAARDVLEKLLANLAAWREIWQAGGFAPVRSAWMARATRLGEPITVRLGNEPQSGSFAGIDPDGALLMQTPQGTRRITAGEVAFG